jgi:PAS domain S-box-containing protein
LDVNKKQLKKIDQEFKERYHNLINNISDIIGEASLEGEITYVSPQVHYMFGYQPEEMIGSNVNKYVHPDDLMFVAEAMRNAIDTGEITSLEYRFPHKKGHYVPISLNGQVIKGDKEDFFIVVIRDNTEKKNDEKKIKESEEKLRILNRELEQEVIERTKELKKSEEKYRLITENANDIIGILNENYEIEYINENTLKKVSGYDLVDVIGKNSLQFIHPEDVEKAVKGLQFGLNHMEGIAELRFRLKDGTYRWFESKGKAIKTEKGDLKGIIILRDITARKVTEKKLKESEEKYRLISENANDLISIFNKRAKFEYVNEAVHYKLMGYSSEDLIGKNGMDLIHPDDLEKVLQEFKKTFETGEGNIEARIRNKDGHYVWTETTGTNFIDRDNKPKVLLFTRIIKERKIAEQKLKESEERFKALFKGGPIPIYTWQKVRNDFELINYNNAAEKFTLGDVKNYLGFKASEMYKDRPDILKDLYTCFDKKINFIREMKYYINILKKEKDLLATYSFVPPDLVLVHTEDITKRKKVTQELKKSEEKYRYIFENARYAIILINLDGVIIDCNPSTERITGYKKQEIIGRNYRNISIIHEKYFNMINKLFRKLFDGEIVHRIDVEFIKKDGSLIWVNIQASVVNIGEKKFMNVLIHDITERKLAESLVKEEVKKMKELDQIRKNLMIRISHELKTPLIPVCSGTELILDRHEEKLEGELGEIIKMIQRGGQRLKMLINRLLDLSRLEYDALLLEKHKSNLSEIIKECSSDMMHLIKNREIALNLDIRDSFYLEIDAMRIEQVITNILSNAIKNTPPKGEISISLLKEDNWAKISVADTGIGLTEEEIKKIFTRFGKIERHGIGLEYLDIKGSGLGLFISKEIVDLHGGSIWAESEGRNMGSTFTVKLPIL